MKVPQQMLFLATGASSFSGSSSSGNTASSFGAPSFCFSALMSSSFCLRFSACTRHELQLLPAYSLRCQPFCVTPCPSELRRPPWCSCSQTHMRRLCTACFCTLHYLLLFPEVRAYQMDCQAVAQTAGHAAHCKELCSPQQHRREPVPQRERPNLQCMAKELSSMALVTGKP